MLTPFIPESLRDHFAAEINTGLWPELAPITPDAPTVALVMPDGSSLPLCSQHDPVAEADRQLDAWENSVTPDWSGNIIVIGFAGPALLNELRRRLRPAAKLILLETRPDLLAAQCAALPENPFSDWEPQQLTILPTTARPLMLLRLGELIAGLPTLARSIFLPPGRLRLERAGISELAELVTRKFRAEVTNRVTVAMYAHVWFRNVIANLHVAFRETPIDAILNAFPGRTALVVAAGPSLDQSLPRMRELAAKSVIIAAGAALPCLRRHGIQPHFVVAVDSDPLIARQLDGSAGESWHLVAPLTVDPELFQLSRGRSFIFTAGLVQGFNLLLRQWSMIPDYLRIGGTVAVTAVDLAVRLGCTSVVMAGLDLSFPDRSSSHATGAVFGGMPKVPDDLISVPGNFTPQVFTTRQFAGYINIIADYVREQLLDLPHLRFINATVGGARLGDIPAWSPEQANALADTILDIATDECILSRRTNPLDGRDIAIMQDSLYDAVMQFNTVADIAADAAGVLVHADSFSVETVSVLKQTDARLRDCPLAMQLSSQLFQTLCQDVMSRQTPDAHRNLYVRFRESALWAAYQIKQAADALTSKT